MLGDAVDRPALAGRIAAFHHHHHALLVALDPVEQLQHFNLQAIQVCRVGLAFQALVIWKAARPHGRIVDPGGQALRVDSELLLVRHAAAPRVALAS